MNGKQFQQIFEGDAGVENVNAVARVVSTQFKNFRFLLKIEGENAFLTIIRTKRQNFVGDVFMATNGRQLLQE